MTGHNPGHGKRQRRIGAVGHPFLAARAAWRERTVTAMRRIAEAGER